MIDLHTHSSASDGTARPAEIYGLAKRMGLTAVALADHDTTGGLDEFLASAIPGGPAAVPGVEISVARADREIHLVGLFIREHCAALEDLLADIRQHRDERNPMIIERLRGMGYDISIAEVQAVAGGDSIGRPLFAKVLVKKGYFADANAVFEQCLKRGAPAYVPRRLPEPATAIAAIHAAGGLAIWAHALHRADNEVAEFRRTLEVLIGAGLDGIEAYYPSFTPAQTDLLLKAAQQHQLAISGGTDYHGANQPDLELGRGHGGMAIPDRIYLDLLARWTHDHPGANQPSA